MITPSPVSYTHLDVYKRQPYSLTASHTVAPDSAEFRNDLEVFAAVCRIVNGLRNLRIGSIGARPAAFNTVRYSEKILEANGISVETVEMCIRDSRRSINSRSSDSAVRVTGATGCRRLEQDCEGPSTKLEC